MSISEPTPPSGEAGAPPSSPPTSSPGPSTSSGSFPADASATRSTPGQGDRPGPAPGALVLGTILVLVGGGILAGRLLDITLGPRAWPLWIIVPGLGMLLGSFAIPSRAGLGLAIPGAIIATVGCVLWVQETYGLYATWAYAWALVAPTGPGIGMLLHGLVHRDGSLAGDGLRTTLVGLGLFIGLGLFFEGVVGLSGQRIANLDEVLPYAAIGLGLVLVVLSLLGGGRHRHA